jgi:hypothetical protein
MVLGELTAAGMRPHFWLKCFVQPILRAEFARTWLAQTPGIRKPHRYWKEACYP